MQGINDGNGMRSGAVMYPACLRGTLTAGPDEVRGSDPNHRIALCAHDSAQVFPIPGSYRFAITSLFTLALVKLFRLTRADLSSRFRVRFASAQDRPGDARHLVGKRHGHQADGLGGQQLCQPLKTSGDYGDSALNQHHQF